MFWGSIHANRNTVERRGSRSIVSKVDNDTLGVHVHSHVTESGIETFHVYMTSGRARTNPDALVGIVRDGDRRPEWETDQPTSIHVVSFERRENPDNPARPFADPVSLCGAEVINDYQLMSHHEIKRGRVNCVKCIAAVEARG